MNPPSVMRPGGISYAYYPILSYMVSAVFMGIAGLFHASADGLLHAARMADVLFVTGAVYFVVKASGKLFPKREDGCLPHWQALCRRHCFWELM
mgnify:CR=1 FL=1